MATEDLYYLLDRMGYQTGIDKDALMLASKDIAGKLSRHPCENTAIAYWQT